MLIRRALGLCLFVLGLLTVALPSLSWSDDEPNPQIVAHLNAGEFPAARVLAQQLVPDMRDIALARIAGAQRRAGARNGWANTVNGMNNVQTGGSGLAGPMFAGQAPGFAGQSPGFGDPGNQGGASQADFTELMDLIKKTTGNPKPGWLDDGGVGTVEPFRGGIYVDASGLLHKLVSVETNPAFDQQELVRAHSGNRDVRKVSALRKVSLTRLERELRLRRTLGESPDEAMQALAGLSKIQYVLLYPESGDIVIAGPASDWHRDSEGRLVSDSNHRPVLQLDDLIVVLRNANSNDGSFGCSIDPRQENLAKLRAHLAASKSPLKPSQREAWVNSIRDLAGIQDVRVFGLDPRTRVAQVMVEADYRMKLIGMGLEDGTLGVPSYLDSVELDKNGQAPPMQVLRWWFTLNYEAIKASKAHDVFELKGKGVKVQSENQLLTEQGKRLSTGGSDELNSRFAAAFTSHFEALAAKYPVYADLQNVFDMALVAALLKAHDLPGQVDWRMSYFTDAEHCPVSLGSAPSEVESIVNHRVIGGTQIIAGVSGGVSVDARGAVVLEKIKADAYGTLQAERNRSSPKNLHENAWWWD